MNGLYYEYLGQGGTSNPELKMWKKVMEKVHEGLEPEKFEISSQTQYRKYCLSGHKCAVSGCSSIAYGYFKSSDIPYCTIHYGYKLDSITPPDQEYYYKYVQEKTETTTKKKDKGKGKNDKTDGSSTDTTDSTDSTQTPIETGASESEPTNAPASN